jgi:hypothetical protein
VSGRPILASAFETVGVTPSKVKGSAVKSNAVVVMRSFFMSPPSSAPFMCCLNAWLRDGFFWSYCSIATKTPLESAHAERML